jgi:thiamine transporter ThiT
MKKNATRNLVLAGLFLALGLVLPFLTGQIPAVGQRLLPMHLPVLLCGFVCGGPYGLLVGLLTPLLRSVLFGMPALFPTALTMAFELAAYGLLAGLFHQLFPRKMGYTYLSLVLAMIGGRVVWGISALFLYGFGQTPFTWPMFVAGAFVNALPGILLQLVVIPPILLALRKSGALPQER